MDDRRGPSPIFFALLTSVLLHIVAAGLLARWPDDRDHSRSLRIEDEDPEQRRQQQEEDPLRLGLDRGQATSITWIGFDEYKEHYAKKSVVDQPDLTMDPPSGEPGEAIAAAEAEPQPASPEPAPPSPQSPPSQPAMAAAPPVPAEPPVTESEQPVAEPARALIAQPAEVKPELPMPVEPVAPAEAEQIATPLPETEPAPERAEPDEPAQPQPESPPAAPKPVPRTPAKGGGETGAQSDRESPASSILTAEWTKLGQPIAAKGLEIKTRKPRFTQYTRLMGAQRDPIVRVHFRRDGRVELVEMVRSSGNPDVDRPVTDAIYQWRATGQSLERIPEPSPPGTLPVEFRILL